MAYNPRTQLTRRELLKAGGAATLLLPFLPQIARAQSAPRVAKRLIIFHTPDGTFPNCWTPLNAAPQAGKTTTVAAPQFNQMLQPLAAIKDQVIMVEGLSFTQVTGNHAGGIAEGLTCSGPDSFDQYIARQLAVPNFIQSLNCGVMVEYDSLFFRNGTNIADLHNNPVDVYNLLFSSGSLDPTTKARRTNMLNAVTQQVAALQKQLGSVEKDKLDTHLQSISDLQRALQRPTPASCAIPTAPQVAGNDFMLQTNFPTMGKLHMDLIVTAMACDMTRVAGLQWTEETSALVPSFASPNIGNVQYHGDLSHSRSNDMVEKLVLGEQWFAQQFVYLVQQLAARPEPTAPQESLLDNTIVLWTRCLGDGTMHTQYSVSYVLAGGGGALKTASGGRYVSYGGLEQLYTGGNVPAAPGGRDPNSAWQPCVGEPHQRLFASVAQAMGVDASGFGTRGAAYPVSGKAASAALAELV